ncbi:undecaprenyldiphospho-muramoylpentapeptide beta-N-acetylglucosaminyltransferase [Hazenella coriacea]|uniref:UDP-N-acetylglucosamine--N-acetylmuramyl-(pentapeptide) pyrophosphoryl-undecaprenol N-acetylglucosamine transferase n=1 Tax=Hazenella coriacea TaxID=1179467 RepID=A0A4V2UVN4_9BACL|nr:undecaprenyldiphospho-muramoylpentapeptide beta-N-acetylglucosaminyltransferase [Hazenella coriacea]TCS95937.1 UDP-N-acetylglucosamine-N-acetylmuramylpentapeptide N-acetylglucosamine transferase [Hazenella coriacea]
MKKQIILTGGGSAGHVTVNLALIPHLLQNGWEISYIGSENGIEKQLIEPVGQVGYHSISTGKLRRYFDWNNFKDPFRVLKGVFQAYSLIKKKKPHIIFSKGGFVSVPVVLGAWLNRVPVIIHESDLTPGLANKLSIPFASKICVTFPETEQHLKPGKTKYIGAVVRDELKSGDAERGLFYCGFSSTKPVLLVMGGSLGAKRINESIRANLESLLQQFQIIHICGKGQVDESLDQPGYQQFEYVKEELPDLMAAADLVISRAGSNSIFEFLTLQKPMLLIPLSKAASRGDQILNAKSFKKSGFCDVLFEEDLTDELLLTKIMDTFEHRDQYIETMKNSPLGDSLQNLLQLIDQEAKK